MTFAIYKQGVPEEVGSKTFVTGQVASKETTAGAYTSTGTASPVVGTAVGKGLVLKKGQYPEVGVAVGIHTIR